MRAACEKLKESSVRKGSLAERKRRKHAYDVVHNEFRMYIQNGTPT